MDSKQIENLGQKIQKLRKERELSQDELARKADIPYTTLTKIEIGVIKNPSFKAVAKIAEALNVTLNDFKDYLNE